MSKCVFCQIVAGEAPSHKILEDEKHLAFLSIYPNTEGLTVAIPKKHLDSYAFNVSDQELAELTVFAKKVGKVLDSYFGDVGRTGMVYEGFGVDHLHAKLFPLHGTGHLKEWKQIRSEIDTYFEKYPGYIASNSSYRAEDEKLAKLAAQIRNQDI